MFIQTETTPNPRTLKFIPGVQVLSGEPMNFKNASEAEISPLALALFSIKNVESVFLGSDFITISKAEEIDWNLIKTEILTTIMEHFVAGRPVLLTSKLEKKNNTTENAAEEDAIVKQIREIIDTRVRPQVAEDGGDIIFHSFEDGVVKLEMHGSCSGCPSSTITLKNGIENMLKHYIPEVVSVEAV